MRINRLFFFIGIVFIFGLQSMLAEGPPWTFSTKDKNTSVKFGFLAQPQREAIDNATATSTENNLFFRRLRLMAGGKLTSKLSYFIESDAANLGKEVAGANPVTDLFLQDAYVSYAFRPEFQLDGGMIIVPVSHNSGQSAASLLSIDYSPYSFLSSTPTRSKNGRDYGVQARGYINKHFEYRVGMFRGDRNHEGDMPYRYMARVVWYPLEADTGFFYTGTTHGTKKIIALGASFDRQGSYSANGIDLFIDHPLPNGDAVTVQGDFLRYDGGELATPSHKNPFASLKQQNTWMLEGSYYFKKAKLGPFIQYSSREFDKAGSPDDSKIQAGLSWWIQNHRINVKAGYGKLLKDNSPDRNQIVVQTQFFYY
jgi:hypothetical protein